VSVWVKQCERVLVVFLFVACGSRQALETDSGQVSDQGIQPDALVSPDRSASNLDGPPLLPDASSLKPNSTCSNALLVPLVGGKAKVTGDTALSQNEYGSAVKCTSHWSPGMVGPQLYYRFSLKAGQPYKISLLPGQPEPLAFYLFTGCGAAQISKDCSSTGATGATRFPVIDPFPMTLTFTPTASAVYYVAVDSALHDGQGTFTLTVEEIPPTTKGTCATAQELTLKNGKATTQGDTSSAADDNIQVSCGIAPFTGPQVYYWIKLTQGKSYILKVSSPTVVPPAFYLFGDSCNPKQIDADCGSKGKTGIVVTTETQKRWLPVPPQSPTTTGLFFPAKTGIYRIAVESHPQSFGAFKLEIEELSPPPNSACATAQKVTLGSGTTIVKGDTTGVPNEFSTAIDCKTPMKMLGSQLYYQVNLTAGKTYSFTLTPGVSFKHAVFYVFGDSCTESAINADCSSKGKTGDFQDVFGSLPTSVTFTPAKSGLYHFVVDAPTPLSYGSFEVTIK
jgi:hypothetical protein